MRIICLSFWFYDYTIQLANSLSKKETVLLMLPKKVPKEYLNAVDEGVELYLFRWGSHMYYPSGLSMMYEIIKQINTFKPDIVHFQSISPPLYLLPLFKKYPSVGTFHDVKPHLGEPSLLHRPVTYYVIKFSDEIIVHGEKLKEQMIKEYNLPNEKVHAITIAEHEVAPFKIYERKDIKEDGNLVLFFGRIWEYKGLEYLIKAEPMITKEVPNAKIVIAGTGEDFKKYEEMMINRDNFRLFAVLYG